MNPASKSPSYLVRNPFSYCFRIRIPLDLQPIFRKKELRYSLKTGYLSVAKSKARLLAGQFQELFRLLRDEGLEMTISEKQINAIIQAFKEGDIRNTLLGPKGEAPNSLNPKQLSELINTVRHRIGVLNADLEAGNYEFVQDQVDWYLGAGEPFNSPKGSPEYEQLCRQAMKSTIENYQNFQEQYSKRLAVASQSVNEGTKNGSVVLDSHQDTGDDILLKKLAETYCHEKKLGHNWTGRTEREYRSRFNLLIKFLGDVPTHKVRHQDIRAYKETLLKLPTHLNAGKYSNKSIKEILSMEYDRTLSPTTVTKYLDATKALFEYAVNNHYIQINPAKGFAIKVRKRPDEQRNIFDNADLKALFFSDPYTLDRLAKPYQFWLPVLGLYTGCRIEELCQLHVEDVKKVNGVWIVDINDDGEKRLKNLPSKRLVPLHPVLASDLRFPDYVAKVQREGRQRVFPELRSIRDRYSHYASRWFGTFKGRCGITSRKKTFHSFRHTFSTTLKQSEVDLVMVSELLGHNIPGETNRYAKKYMVDLVYPKAILKLDYDLDLSHLKNSKYVVK